MRLRRATAVVLAAMIAAAGCTGQESSAPPTTPMTPIGSATTSGAGPAAVSGSDSESESESESESGSDSGAAAGSGSDHGVPPAVVEKIRATIEAVNGAAGTSPDQQRAVFERVVDPGHVQQQQSCGAATTTVRFEPSWNDLRPTPGDEPDSYQLPALIRVYTGDRITRTDVTSLTVTISAGQAHLPPICVA